MMIPNQRVSNYQTDGYVVIPDFLNETEVADLKSTSRNMMALLINSSLFNRRTSTRLDIRQRPTGETLLRKVQPLLDISPTVADLAHSTKMVSLVSELIDGQKPELLEESLNYKQHIVLPVDTLTARKSDEKFLVHNDWTYHREQGYPSPIVCIGIYLDEAHERNGPLQVWPGSHVKHIEHEKKQVGGQGEYNDINAGWSWYVPDDKIPNPKNHCNITGPAGTLVAFDGKLLHSSSINQTLDPRRLLMFFYCAAESSPGLDVRNRATRELEQPFEHNYLTASASGNWQDQFIVPKEQ